MSKLKTKWVNTSAAIGGADIESSADGVTFSNEQVDMIETGLTSSKEEMEELAANKAKVASLTADLETATEAKKTAEDGAAALQSALTETETKLTAANNLVTANATEINELKTKLAAKPLNTKKALGSGTAGETVKYPSIEKAKRALG